LTYIEHKQLVEQQHCQSSPKPTTTIELSYLQTQHKKIDLQDEKFRAKLSPISDRSKPETIGEHKATELKSLKEQRFHTYKKLP